MLGKVSLSCVYVSMDAICSLYLNRQIISYHSILVSAASSHAEESLLFWSIKSKEEQTFIWSLYSLQEWMACCIFVSCHNEVLLLWKQAFENFISISNRQNQFSQQQQKLFGLLKKLCSMLCFPVALWMQSLAQIWRVLSKAFCMKGHFHLAQISTPIIWTLWECPM